VLCGIFYTHTRIPSINPCNSEKLFSESLNLRCPHEKRFASQSISICIYQWRWNNIDPSKEPIYHCMVECGFPWIRASSFIQNLTWTHLIHVGSGCQFTYQFK